MGRVSAGGYQVRRFWAWCVVASSLVILDGPRLRRRLPGVLSNPARPWEFSLGRQQIGGCDSCLCMVNTPVPSAPTPASQTGGIPGVGGRMVPNAAMLQRASLVKVH